MTYKKSNSNNKKKLQRSLDNLYNIFQEISSHADELSKSRCPYKDAKNLCTASFYCNNQHYTDKNSEVPICTGSHKLDYRPAWEVDRPIKKNE